MKEIYFTIPIVIQKEEECACASLLQVLKYYEDSSSLDDINLYLGKNYKSRDWDYLLGCFSLEKGFKVKIHTRSLATFDSTWFDIDKKSLEKKLETEKEYLENRSQEFIGYKKLQAEVEAAIKFLRLGGEIDFSSFSKELVYLYLAKQTPVISTFTAQLVFMLPREDKNGENDIKGKPWKHTFVINGYKKNRFFVTDPTNFRGEHIYSVDADVLIDAIIRYDNNLITLMRNN